MNRTKMMMTIVLAMIILGLLTTAMLNQIWPIVIAGLLGLQTLAIDIIINDKSIG